MRSVRQWGAIVLATVLASLLVVATTGGLFSNSPGFHSLYDAGHAPMHHPKKSAHPLG